jgi:hypothetical protein
LGVTYDAGALIAADRGDRQMWLRHRALLKLGEVPTAPAPVVAQAWRGGARQAMLSRFLAGCTVEPMDDQRARSTGALAALAGTPDVVDACVVEGALRRRDVVITSDPGDLTSMASAVGRVLEVESP